MWCRRLNRLWGRLRRFLRSSGYGCDGVDVFYHVGWDGFCDSDFEVFDPIVDVVVEGFAFFFVVGFFVVFPACDGSVEFFS